VNQVFNNERPIYIQLIDKIRIDIVSGKLKASERLPSVRDLALTSKVNPNTIQKALMELEKEGLIYTESTNGKYVTENKKLIESIKKRIAKDNASKYLKEMDNIGISYEDAIRCLQEIGGIK